MGAGIMRPREKGELANPPFWIGIGEKWRRPNEHNFQLQFYFPTAVDDDCAIWIWNFQNKKLKNSNNIPIGNVFSDEALDPEKTARIMIKKAREWK
jgi:hypothetical protein